jgi:23S rRNA pseudouridine2605 synthase
MIADGIVTVNNIPAKLGDSGELLKDDIRVNGEKINKSHSKNTYIILNKPPNILSEIKDDRKRRTVIDLVNHDGYLFIVGRLDYQSEGLILLTDDGDIANKLTHPRFEHEKEYQVLVSRNPTKDQYYRWEKGLRLPDGNKTLPTKVVKISTTSEGTWLRVILREGKKRQIREIGKVLGLPVKRIIRTRIGPIRLEDMEPGQWRYLERTEIAILKKSCT